MNKQKEFEMNRRFRFVLVLALLVILVGASVSAAAAQSVGSITIGPDTLGAEYKTWTSQQLNASGGTEPYTFSLSGTLPYGITLSSSGLLSGFPDGPDADPGSYSITIQVLDANGATASRDYSFVLDKGTPAVTANADSNISWNHPFTLATYVLKDQGGGSYYPLLGTVAFSIDGVPVLGCEAVILDNGFARCPGVSMDLSIGVHNFEAAYTPAGGDEAYFYPATGSGTLTVQAGSYTINGSIFSDKNQNGVFDAGEYTMIDKNWTINLDQGCNGTVDYSTSVSNGLYSFSSMPGGQCYHITEVIGEPGWQQTSILTDFWLSSNANMINIGNYYPTITISPSELPDGNVGLEYNQAFTANGGTEPYVYTITTGELPAGLTLAENGVLSGTPTVAGSFSFGIQAEDATHAVGKGAYTLGIKTDGVFTFTSSSNPSAPGEAVTFTVSATGDVILPGFVDPVPPLGQVTFYDDGIAIAGCSDLYLNIGSSDVGNYPAICATAALEPGAHQITAVYRDMTGYVNTPNLALTQQVEQPVSYTISGDIFDDNDKDGARDADENLLYFSGQVDLDQGCDGVTDHTAWVAGGRYVFSGIPGGECNRITIALDESGWQQTTQLADFALSGDATLDIGFYYPDITFSPSPSELPSGSVGVEYYQQFTASGGTEPYLYGMVASSLPDSLTLSVGEGGFLLSGTPTVTGYYEFTLGTMDATGAQKMVDYQLTIKTDGDFTFTSSSNPSASGEAVTFTVSATGDIVNSSFDPIPPVGLVTFYDDGVSIEGCSDLPLNLGFDSDGYQVPGNYPARCETAALTEGTHTITATYNDYVGFYNSPELGLTQVVGQLPNTAPTANPGGPYLAAVNTVLSFNGSASYDPDGDPLAYTWDFGDGSTGADAMPTHSYSAAAIYNVCLTANDGTVNSVPVCTIAVVYDPSGGFVSGGGWFDSQPGAYKPDSNLSGKATFGFVSKYQKGAQAPTGTTGFAFQAGSFSFTSTAYEWLVVNRTGNTAQFKGSGTVNGAMDPNGKAYKFQVWAGDGTSDTFRIKIWWEDAGGEHVVYDNSFDQTIGGGSIIVHTGK